MIWKDSGDFEESQPLLVLSVPICGWLGTRLWGVAPCPAYYLHPTQPLPACHCKHPCVCPVSPLEPFLRPLPRSLPSYFSYYTSSLPSRAYFKIMLRLKVASILERSHDGEIGRESGEGGTKVYFKGTFQFRYYFIECKRVVSHESLTVLWFHHVSI